MRRNETKWGRRVRRAWIALAVTVGITGITLGILTIRYFFSDWFINPRIVEVPDLVGTVYREGLLPDGSGIQVVRIGRYDDAPSGTVLSQEPAGGSRRKVTDGKRFVTVTLVVSRGRETAVLPSVVGQTESRGKAAVLGAGFSVRIRWKRSRRPYGEILRTEPAAGTSLPLGTDVILVLSTGPVARAGEARGRVSEH